jgi:hypothetical protein
MCLLDNNSTIPSGDDGFYCRFVFDTWRKRRATSSSVYVQNGRDSLWFLHIFICEGAARWSIRGDSGGVNFSTKEISQDFSASDNQQAAQGRSFKVPFICSSRYITGTIIKENQTSARGRLKFGIEHPNYHTANPPVPHAGAGSYVYDAIDDSKQFALAT